RLLDVAVSAVTFEGLGYDGDRPLACPELRDRDTDPLEVRFGGFMRAVERTRQPHHQDRRGLRLDREVGEHADHQRLLAEKLAECAPVCRVMGRLSDRL